MMSLVKGGRKPAAIIPRIRHGGWEPTGARDGRQYRKYSSSRGDWQYRDGAWREMRDPTDAEIEVTDGSTQTVGFGEHADKTYGEVQTKKPQYAVYPMTEDHRNQYEAKKFIKRIERHQIENA